ncbi:hypothetical protein [Defluviitalea phaphyphila]|uniref:hypothetical protein n=1 Tax=Defluviitalea phaphyphila TaxID=1473580 RepID=UPI00072FBABC|nr:hypothetical protein [Defluviitalea phaphyphila]
MGYKDRKSLKLCAGKDKDCDWEAILEALGNPEDCTDQSIIQLLCDIAQNLPIDIDLTEIIDLLTQILDSLGGGISDSTGQTSDTGIITYSPDEAVKITAIYASYTGGGALASGIEVDIVTTDGTTSTPICKFNAINIPTAQGGNFATNLIYPLLVVPPPGQWVEVHASVSNGDGSENVLLTVLNAI